MTTSQDPAGQPGPNSPRCATPQCGHLITQHRAHDDYCLEVGCPCQEWTQPSDQPDDQAPYRAYYFQLDPTGSEPIDAILKEIAAAGKASHSTEGWGGQEWGDPDPDTPNYIQRIQEAANRAAELMGSKTANPKLQPQTVREFLDHMTIYHMPLPPHLPIIAHRAGDLDWREAHQLDHLEQAAMRIPHSHEEEQR